MRNIIKVGVAGLVATAGLAAGSAAAAAVPRWRVVYDNQNAGMLGVAALGLGIAWAVGLTAPERPVVLRWNGRSWWPAKLPGGLAGILTTVGASSRADVFTQTGSPDLLDEASQEPVSHVQCQR